MSFVTPGLALAGLLAVSIPILIHLLWRQRRRPVEWAAMRFLMEAWKRQRRRIRLEQWLLLLLRCLILVALGLALARPRFAADLGPLSGSGRTLYLVIDNGLASGAVQDGDRTALDRHVEQAIDVIDQLAPGDRVALLTAATPARAVLTPPTTDIGSVRGLLRALTPQMTATDLAGAFRILDELIVTEQASGEVLAVVMSDFRSGSARLTDPLPVLNSEVADGSALRVFATAPASAPAGNVSVTAIEPVRSVILSGARDGSDVVTVRLRRSGGDLQREVVSVRLSGDGVRPMPARAVTFEAGDVDAAADFVLEFDARESRDLVLEAEIDADAIEADNVRSSVLTLRRSIRGVVIDRRLFGLDPALDRLGAGRWVVRALEPMRGPMGAAGPIETVETEPAAFTLTDLLSADFAFVIRPDLVGDDGWRALRTFAERGGLLVVMPPAEVPVHQWTDALREHLSVPWQFERETRQTGGLALDPEVPSTALLRMIAADLSELVLPVEIERLLVVTAESQDAEVHLRTADGDPFMLSMPIRGSGPQPGTLLFIASALQLDWTSLPTRPLMVPLLQETVRQGVSEIRGRFAGMTGQQPAFPDASFVRLPAGDVVPFASDRRPVRPLLEPGVHVLLDDAREPVRLFSVNIDADAATTDPQSADQVQQWLGRAGAFTLFEEGDEVLLETLSEERSASPIAIVLLILLLLLVVAETFSAQRLGRTWSGTIGRDARGIRPTIESAHDGGAA